MTPFVTTSIVNGELYYCARWPSGARAFGDTEAEAIRALKEEFPDDGAKFTEVES
jgi:hypothetical protein